MIYISETTKETECCERCKHFIQHYYRRGGYYVAVAAGHCISPRIRTKKPDDCCDRFERREKDGQSR